MVELKNSTIYMLNECYKFNMSYVIVTGNGKIIVVDGGRPQDYPQLIEYIGGRTVDAWFLTHPHVDHITAFMDIIDNHRDEVDIKKVYYNFHTTEFIAEHEPVNIKMLQMWDEIKPKIADISVVPQVGDIITVDDFSIEILFTADTSITKNATNCSSMVFMMNNGRKKILFLGDLGPWGGDKLLQTKYKELKCDIVQMSHHGHLCCDFDVYLMASPEICMWNCEEWLYNEADTLQVERRWGTMHTRKWMELLGVKKHYVTKDGTQEIPI